MAQVFMIASGKGGTGKSTVAAYISLEMALSGKKTLLIELDAGLRSIDIITGVEGKTVYDIGDVLQGRCDAEKAWVQSPNSNNLFIIAAPYKNTNDDFSGFGKLVNSFVDEYDCIVIDTAAGFPKAFYRAAKTADTGIVVTTPDVVSVRDAKLTCDEMYAGGVRTVRLIINKFSRENFTYSGFENVDKIIDFIGARLLGVVPFSGAIAQCGANGSPLDGQSKEKSIFNAIYQRIFGNDIQIII